MDAIVLTVLIESFCFNYIENEYGEHIFSRNSETIEEINHDYKVCIDNTTEKELFFSFEK